MYHLISDKAILRQTPSSTLSKPVQIFLLSAIGLITLPHIQNVPPLLFAFFSLMLAWRFMVIWNTQWLPNKVLLLLATLTGITLLYAHHQGILGLDAGTSIFVTALGLKMLEVRNKRDIYLSVFLAFIVAATQFLYLQNVFMAFYTLAVCCALVATLICVNSQNPRPVAAIKTAAVIVMQALPLAIVMFLFFPRIEAPRWMMFQEKPKTRLGLNDVLEPGSITDLGLSGELAFRVKFKGPIPPNEQRYWRGPVFTHTDGKRWTENKTHSFIHQPDKPQFDGTAYRYTLLMEPQTKKWVFALDMPAEFPAETVRNSYYQLITSKDPEKRAEYALVSYPRYNTGGIGKTEVHDNLQLPGQASPRIKTLVEQLQGFQGNPETFIKNLLSHFRNNAFIYTLQPPLMEENPIETFLFETRRGFCSHYATAFVYLMRVAGIPSRIIGGYQGGELNTAGNFLEIRQANAHAWAEVWLDKRGWTRVDPTAAIAPERIEQDVNVDLQIAQGEVNFTPVIREGSGQKWLRKAGYLWDSLDYHWQRWVVNYSSGNQSSLLEFLNIGSLTALAYWLAGALLLVTVPLAWLLLRNKTRQGDKAVRIYNRFCRKLAKKGLLRQTHEGPRDFAYRAAAALPDKAVAIDNITALYIGMRYGKNPAKSDLQLLRRRVREFRA